MVKQSHIFSFHKMQLFAFVYPLLCVLVAFTASAQDLNIKPLPELPRNSLSDSDRICNTALKSFKFHASIFRRERILNGELVFNGGVLSDCSHADLRCDDNLDSVLCDIEKYKREQMARASIAMGDEYLIEYAILLLLISQNFVPLFEGALEYLKVEIE